MEEITFGSLATLLLPNVPDLYVETLAVDLDHKTRPRYDDATGSGSPSLVRPRVRHEGPCK